MNCVDLTGRLVRDVETLAADGRTSTASMQVAVDALRSDPISIEVVAVGRQAEACARYLRRGRLVAVSGRLEQAEQQRDGADVRLLHRVIAQRVGFLDRRDDDHEPSRRIGVRHWVVGHTARYTRGPIYDANAERRRYYPDLGREAVPIWRPAHERGPSDTPASEYAPAPGETAGRAPYERSRNVEAAAPAVYSGGDGPDALPTSVAPEGAGMGGVNRPSLTGGIR